MLGGMRPWAQFIALGLSLIAFGLSIFPRRYQDHLVHGEAYTFVPLKKLIRWPLFWIGLVFFGYVLIQALNPAYEFLQLPTSWGMVPIAHIEWLPTGMRTPFAMMNPWRQMMIWGAPFLLACALWAGLTRRKSVISLLTAIVANATVLAIVGIVARATANGSILWLVKGQKDYAFASFIYKNHAGSFFALTLGLPLALAIYHHTTAQRKRLRSSPAPLMVFLAMIQAVAVLQSYSRAAILITGAFLVVFTLVAGGRLLWTGGLVAAPLLLGIFVVGLVGFGFMATKLVNSEKTLDRLQSLTDADRTDHSVLSRQIAWQAGLEMSSERPNLGWGAGGFRFLFPRYQQTRPEITYHIHPNGVRQYAFWEHAHNDYLQLLIETGRIGVGLIGLAFFTAGFNFIRSRGLSHSTALALLGAGGISLAHAGADFPLQNPAILVTFATTALFVLLLPRLETRSR
jgi:O-antigen ligase